MHQLKLQNLKRNYQNLRTVTLTSVSHHCLFFNHNLCHLKCNLKKKRGEEERGEEKKGELEKKRGYLNCRLKQEGCTGWDKRPTFVLSQMFFLTISGGKGKEYGKQHIYKVSSILPYRNQFFRDFLILSYIQTTVYQSLMDLSSMNYQTLL